MEPNQYYQTLLQQGHSPADAAHFTSQYYPGFQAPMQGAGMMAPPPSGMEFGSMASPGMGSPYGGYTGGSMAAPAGFGYSSMPIGAGMAATGAAAGGGAKIAIITVVSVLVLGGAGTAGYFIYDYLTEPDFYGETYWTEFGMGYQFEEDKMIIVVSTEDSDECDMMEDFFSEDSTVEYKNGLCYIDASWSSYGSEDKGDYYKICVKEDDDDENDCIRVYPLDGGAVMKNDGECTVIVSDIRTPQFSLWEEDSDEAEDWLDDFRKIAEDLEDEGPDNCDYKSILDD